MAMATAAVKKKSGEALIRISEAATRLGLSIKTVYRLIDEKQLSAIDMLA